MNLASPYPAALPLLLALFAIPVAARTTSDASRIPTVHATSLTGQQIDLPAQLQGRTAVLILGFTKESRIPTRDWGLRLATDYFASSTVSYFEMPVLAGVPRLLRGIVLKQIAAEVSDRGKPHFVPITADEPRWQALAHYSQPDAAYLLVVDSSGQVRDTFSGPLTDASYTRLQQAIHAASP